jgi:serine protease inhibitor
MEHNFALDLYRLIAGGEPNENVFLSPYSIFTALAMTAEGARGETADEMGRVLHLRGLAPRDSGGWDLAPVHAGLQEVATALQRGAGVGSGLSARIDSLRKALAEANAAATLAMDRRDWEGMETQQELKTRLAAELIALLPQVDRYELRMANALWADASYPISPDFVRALDTYYGTGGVQAIDYRHDAEGARWRINAWAADQTEQRIRDLLPAGSVGPLTRLVLANAIWFKGEWGEVFDPRATQEAPFAGDSASRVPLMHHELEGARYAAFRADGTLFPTVREVRLYSHDDPADPKFYPGAGGFQIAELPYKGGGLSMVVLLPRSADGLGALEQQLDAARLSAWIRALEGRSTDVFLPRFRLEQGHGLRVPLEAMGMKRAFVNGSAQFDGMSSGTNPADALFVGAVLHKAFLEVNEKGTEAAAAIGLRYEHEESPHALVPTFRADRPFLFLIRDRSSGAILFIGRFARP